MHYDIDKMTDKVHEVETTELAGRAEFALLYAIVEKGFYRHRVGGIFTSLKLASVEAKARVLAEEDHYHDWFVLEFRQTPLWMTGNLFALQPGIFMIK
jgi:hypothetical protein